MKKLTFSAIALISAAVLLGNSVIAESTTNSEAEKKTASYVQVIADESSSLMEEVRAEIQRELSRRIRDAIRELPLSLNGPG
ncbi:hypothetical protein [Alkalimonas amylolytica]|uniref:Uncharacterized protein n=1 Tax=Alkalimonas amylolytica TaxID=152573 RepID=A0A1H4D5J8_ALKAM|nr:hypothetical protein [Alkalimonas amylolytica]SEA67760.1 hypothetical protein SAMN04488051_10573 [Alkalimonas amylolytica]